MVEFLALEVSDHCPAIIHLQHVNESPPKPFRFFNFWTKHLQFLDLVKESWQIPISESPMRALHGKLKRLKFELRRFNQIQFGNLISKMADKRKELVEV